MIYLIESFVNDRNQARVDLLAQELVSVFVDGTVNAIDQFEALLRDLVGSGAMKPKATLFFKEFLRAYRNQLIAELERAQESLPS